MTIEEMAGSTVAELQSHIDPDDTKETVGTILHAVATQLHNDGGTVPTTKDALVDCGVENIVARLLVHRVFGSTELVIGLHCRKVVCALDMFDWEESGANKKDSIKMARVPAGPVRSSLQAWLPKGQWQPFQEALDSLGRVVGANEVGFWGKLKTVVNKHYSPADKKKLMAMAESILQFYKATKSGERKKCNETST